LIDDKKRIMDVRLSKGSFAAPFCLPQKKISPLSFQEMGTLKYPPAGHDVLNPSENYVRDTAASTEW